MPAIILSFDANEVRELLAHASAASRKRIGLTHCFDKAYWRPQAKPDEFGFVEASDVDETKVPKHLLLVKDEGIYLMSAGLPILSDPKRPGRSKVAYARGFGCDASYDALRAAVGGDDFAECLEVEVIASALPPHAKELGIRVSAKQLEILMDRGCPEPARKNGGRNRKP